MSNSSHRHRTSIEPQTMDGAGVMARGKPKKCRSLLHPRPVRSPSPWMVVFCDAATWFRRWRLGSACWCWLPLNICRRHSTTMASSKTLRQLPPGLLVRSLAATALSYLALIGRDAVALRYIGARVPRPLLWIGTRGRLRARKRRRVRRADRRRRSLSRLRRRGGQRDPGGASERPDRRNLRVRLWSC